MADPYKRDRRLGRWVISGMEMAEYPGRLEEIQRGAVILRAEPMFVRDAMQFIGRSPDFDITEDGEEVPLYRPHVENNSVKWERI